MVETIRVDSTAVRLLKKLKGDKSYSYAIKQLYKRSGKRFELTEMLLNHAARKFKKRNTEDVGCQIDKLVYGARK